MGNIQNRERFLNRVAKNLGRKRCRNRIERPEWRVQPQWDVLANDSQDQLVDVLEKQCESIHTDFIRTNIDHLSEDLQKVIETYEGERIITSDDQRFSSFGLNDSFKTLEEEKGFSIMKWDPMKAEESIHFAEKADIGITFSDITLAESGTVVLFSEKGKGRSVSLLPKTYIAIIPKSTIVQRMSQATREIHRRVERGEEIASCINFITGPSNSADIEMNLVVGVHGPYKAAYVFVEDQ